MPKCDQFGSDGALENAHPDEVDTQPSAAPGATRTFRVRGLQRAQEIAAGLINRGQWFTCTCTSPHSPVPEYEFVMDSATPISGYDFIPTEDPKLYEGDERYGLRVK